MGGCDCDEQAHKGEVAHDIAVLAQKRAVADAVAPGSRSTARRPFRAVLGENWGDGLRVRSPSGPSSEVSLEDRSGLSTTPEFGLLTG